MANTPVEVKRAPVPARQSWPGREMEHLFDRFGFGMPSSRRLFEMEPLFRTEMTVPNPAVDIAEDANAFKLTAELPGMEEKDIEVSIDGDMLTLKGEKKQESKREEGGYTLSERSYGSFQRSFWLPEAVDRARLAASFAKGVLTITMPKSPDAAKSTKIEVKSGD